MKNNIKYLLLLNFILNYCLVFGQCDYTNGSISVSTSGYKSATGYTQTYVLVNDATGLITDIQASGSFTNISNGNYRIYAVNYKGLAPVSLAVGSLWSTVETYNSNTDNCIDLLGPKDGVVTVCENACFNTNLVVSTINYKIGTNYSQTYVLVNSNDSIYAYNNSGTFSSTDFKKVGEFRIFAVNTNDPDVVAEITDKGLWSEVVAMELSTCTEYIGAQYFNVITCAPAPLSEIELYGEEYDEYNLLKWNLTNSSKVEKCIIYRSINNNSNYNQIGQIAKSDKNSLEFEDYDFSSVSKYKVKALYTNGETVWSNEVELNHIDSKMEVSVYPNPTTGKIAVEFDLEKCTTVNYQITDAVGKTITLNTFEGKIGQNKIDLDFSDLSNGIYYLKISDSQQVVLRKIVKQG